MVLIADTVAEFVAAAEGNAEDSKRSGWLRRVDNFLAQISWDHLGRQSRLIESAINVTQLYEVTNAAPVKQRQASAITESI